MSLLSGPGARKLSRHAPADAGVLCDKAAVLGDTIKGTPCVSHLDRLGRCGLWIQLAEDSLLSHEEGLRRTGGYSWCIVPYDVEVIVQFQAVAA
jgi:hypothetical protein